MEGASVPGPRRGGRAALVGGSLITAALLAIGWLGGRDRAAPARTAGPDAFGARLLAGELIDEGPRVTRFRLNGIAVSATRGGSGAALADVLDAARAECAGSGPIDPLSMAAAMGRASSGDRMASTSAERPGCAGVTSAIEEDRGLIVCLDRAASAAMRYAYAERVAPGEVRFVVVWTDRAVRLADLERAGEDGAVEGDDVPSLPLPPSARRRFSFARVDGRAHTAAYGVSVSPSELERWAVEALPAAGWSAPVGAAGHGELGGGAERVLSTRRGEQHVHLVLRDDGTLVVIAQRAPQSPSP